MLEGYKYIFGIGAIALLFLPRLPGIGETINGARLWIHVGGLQFQPGELAKIFLIIFLAGYVREKREVLAQGRPKDVGPVVVIWAAAMLVLVSTNDLGSALLYFGIFIAMLYIATARLTFVVAGLGLFVAGELRRLPRDPARGRAGHDLAAPLDDAEGLLPDHRHDGASAGLPELPAREVALLDRGGGSWGTGLGKGTFTTVGGTPLIPDVNTDFIYSALAQELGLIGVSALLLVFMVFVARGMKIALQVDDGFSKLLAAGLTFGFALQTFVIVGGILRIIPLTGITLPFVSYGGSSVISNFLLLALLLLDLQPREREGLVNKQSRRWRWRRSCCWPR